MITDELKNEIIKRTNEKLTLWLSDFDNKYSKLIELDAEITRLSNIIKNTKLENQKILSDSNLILAKNRESSVEIERKNSELEAKIAKFDKDISKFNGLKDFVEKELSDKESLVSKLESKSRDLEKYIEDKNVELLTLSSEIKSIKLERIALDKDKESYSASTSTRQKQISDLDRDIEIKKNLIINHNNTIKQIEKLSSTYPTLKKQEEDILNNIKAEKISLNEIISEKENLLNYVTELKKSSTKEIETLKIELEKQKSVILPTIEQLNEREKIVSKRERDLDIIIERYKKLYQDKGVNFRI